MKITMRQISAACVASSLFIANAAYAAFASPYTLANGTAQPGNGFITTTGNNILSMTSSNTGTGNKNTNFEWTASTTGPIGFDWSYSSSDTSGNGASVDPFQFVNNAAVTDVFATTTLLSGSGHSSFIVTTGTLFSFRIRAADGLANGSANVQITNLTVGPVPEPETYLLMGLGTFAFAYARRRQQKNKAQAQIQSPRLEPVSA